MAEEKAKQRLYAYEANSNLVLNQARGRRRDASEPSGEAAVRKLALSAMGDRVGRAAPKAAGKEKGKERQEARDKRAGESMARGGPPVGAPSASEALGLYRPKTRETQAAFEELLASVQRYLGAPPRELVVAASDEVLALVKDGERSVALKQGELRKLLGRGVDDAAMTSLLRLCERITDYAPARPEDAEAASQQPEQDAGVAVVFDSDEDEDSEGRLSVVAESESDSEGDAEGGAPGPQRAGQQQQQDQQQEPPTQEYASAEAGADAGASRRRRGGAPDAGASGLIDVHEIDAYWLQRQLGEHYPDATEAQALALEVLDILGQVDERACENQLVLLLEFDKFELIKTLLVNRKRVWFCSRLKQAQSAEAREAVVAEMQRDRTPGGGQDILDSLERRVGSAGESAATGAGGVLGDRAAQPLASRRRLQVVDADVDGVDATAVPAPAYAPPQRVDLSQLVFGSGDHTMTNRAVKLPKAAWRKQEAEFEEVHVPPPKPRAFAEGEELTPILSLPQWAQAGFKGMTVLNRVQSRICPTALNEDVNLLVCAPTGAGKTNVAVLCVLHEISKFVGADGQVDTAALKEGLKMVYIAPMKALVQEVVRNFSQRLGAGAYDLVVRELSGDQQLSRAEIAETQIIVTTPEKWDVVTRKAGERAYTQLVRLVIVDEIHLLHNERGAVLEAVIARALRAQELSQQRVRLVGISATLPNYRDVAAFLRVPADRGLFFFDNSFRPVPLQQQYVGITAGSAVRRFALYNEICYAKAVGVLRRNAKDQLLVFVHSRKDTALTARALLELAAKEDRPDVFVNADKAESKEVLRSEAEERARNADLRELLPGGVGIHHAGMSKADRTLVEDLFKAGYLKVLVCTATLAWGVNLPAHAVVIKGTQVYSPDKGRWTELSQLDILQMLGRAGRPQYDTEGEGVIITSHQELQYYLSLMNEQLPVESQLLRTLPDALNAEVVAGSVQNLGDAARWLGYTYLYVRMLRNPALYGVDPAELEREPTLLQRRADLSHSAALLLDKAALVSYDRRSGLLTATPLGRISSHYYVSHDSMQRLNDFLRPHMTDIDLFRALGLAQEFQNIVVRAEDKPELLQLAERAPVAIKEAPDEPSAKVNLLLQSYISGLRLDGYALACDLVFVQQSGSRLARALFEVALAKGWATLALRCLELASSVDHRMWPSQCFLRQLSGCEATLTPEVLQRLERHNLSVDATFALSPQELGELAGGGLKQGRALHRIVHCFPRLQLAAHVQPITRSTLSVELTLTPDFEYDAQLYHGAGALAFWVIVEDHDGQQVMHHELLSLTAASAQTEQTTQFTVTLGQPLPPLYLVRVVSDRFLHAQSALPLSFRKLVPPERSMPPTELLDLRPLPTARAAAEAAQEPALKQRAWAGRALQRLFADRFDTFNAVQTQAFAAVFKSGDNCLVAAPAGSGKTALAELAIVRALAEKPGPSTAVYVSAAPQVSRQRLAQWASAASFAGLGVRVVMLTGEVAADLKLLATPKGLEGPGSLVVATPEQWDNISRKWKQRKAVRDVALFVADELHLVGSQARPVMEVVVSRMRFLAASGSSTTRLVGLSGPVANCSDLASWIGAQSAKQLFNMHPSTRPNRLEVDLRGFDEAHLGTRMLAMARPAFDAVRQHCFAGAGDKKRAVVFVPTKRQALVTAVDMVTFASAWQADQELEAPLFTDAARQKRVREQAAKLPRASETTPMLEHGVAVLHEGMDAAERALAEACFEAGEVRVLVVQQQLVWGMSLSADLVVVLGTTRREGGQNAELPVSELAEMVGRASTQGEAARVVVLCSAKRKAFYRTFLHDPLPVESHLHLDMADALCAEVVAGVVNSKQEAVDYLTWTLLFRRLTKNPNYYNLLNAEPEALSDYLSELVEATLGELAESKCVRVEDNDMDLAPLNLGMIASHYYLQYTTVKLFAANLHKGSRLRRVLDVLVSAEELELCQVRPGEEKQLRELAKLLPVPLTEPDFGEARTKAHVLLQLHVSRRKLSPEQRADLDLVLDRAPALLQAMVDIISSSGWLRPALAAMELSQMLVQARWNTDSPLLQVPFFDVQTVERCHAAGVKRVEDIAELDEEQLQKVLQLAPEQMAQAAEFCNAYPAVEMSFALQSSTVAAGSAVDVAVTLERVADADDEQGQGGGDEALGRVIAPFFPKPKLEQYWLVVGDPEANALLSIKKTTLGRKATSTLQFDAPKETGSRELKLYLMCDSVQGADQVVSLRLDVQPGDGAHSDDSSDSDADAES